MGSHGNRADPNIERDVVISARDVDLKGTLAVPEKPCCLVIFAHGSGSSRLSRRNLSVARSLNKHGIATLLFDLLTQRESSDRSNVFDIDLLVERLIMATQWVRKRRETEYLPTGYFGASTGAAAALKASIINKLGIGSIVSRGGRPDLAWEVLDKVEAPTLLIVGSSDYGVVELNDRAYERLKCYKRLELVPDATHLFEEPGAMEKVTELATIWFLDTLPIRKSAYP